LLRSRAMRAGTSPAPTELFTITVLHLEAKMKTNIQTATRQRYTLIHRFGIGALLSIIALTLCLACASVGGARHVASSQTSGNSSEAMPETASSAQGAITGQWLIETQPNSDKVYFSISRRNENGGMHDSSSDVSPDKFRGLTREQMMSGGGVNVRFEMVRDAGTITCEGWFKNGKGSGHWTFAPSGAFLGEMQRMGYQQLSSEDLFAMAVHDVTVAFIEELRALGYERPPKDDLIAMRIHGVASKFIIDLKAMGYDRVPVDDLVAMRIHGVTIDFVRNLEKAGYRNPEIDNLVALRIHNVSNEFINELKELGYTQIPLDDLVAMRIHGVETEFIKELQALGYNNVEADDLVAMKIHGVTTEFIGQLKNLGYDKVAIDDLVAMKIHGVTIAFIEKMRSRGLTNLSIEKLVEMKIHGIGE
ncbi:MAG: hypothetical protein WBP93_16965, partial [Pyrinomonadaceae bacterium]